MLINQSMLHHWVVCLQMRFLILSCGGENSWQISKNLKNFQELLR